MKRKAREVTLTVKVKMTGEISLMAAKREVRYAINDGCKYAGWDGESRIRVVSLAKAPKPSPTITVTSEQWQPMDTVPLGEPVMLLSADGDPGIGVVKKGSFDGIAFASFDAAYVGTGLAGSFDREARTYIPSNDGREPLGWMPFPKAKTPDAS